MRDREDGGGKLVSVGNLKGRFVRNIGEGMGERERELREVMKGEVEE